MKIDLALISAVLDSVFKENKVAKCGAIPLSALVEHWDSVRLRRSDLATSIDALRQNGLVELETMRDELWVRRKGNDATTPPSFRRLLTSVDRFMNERAIDRVRKRQGDGYSGMDRRIAPRESSKASGDTR